MSQSVTATLGAPRPAPVSKNSPAPLLTAAAALGLAHLPLLKRHFEILWTKPHYELFWLIFLGTVVLAAPAWRKARAALAAEPTGRTAGLALLGLNWLMLVAAILMESPWLGMVSFWELLVAVAVLAGGWPVLRAALPALAFLLLVVPPPFNLDGRLVYALQGLTSRVSSKVLDYFTIVHFVEGNAFEVGERKYLVDKACSGINSLFSTLTVTLFYLLWARAHWVRGVLLVLSAVFWVVVANVVRVSSIVLIDTRWGIDLSKDGWDWQTGKYFQHTIYGFFLFGIILALVYSSNQFLRFLGTTVRWGTDASTAGEDEPEVPAGRAVPNLAWGVVAPLLVGYGVLFLFQLGELQLGAMVTESAQVKSFNNWTAEEMPEQIGQWHRQEFTFESRDRDNPFGVYSRSWQYQTKSGLAAIVSFDYPFVEWHDLTLCYKSIGWGMTDMTTFDQPVKLADATGVRDGALGCVQFELAKPFERRGYGWFTEFDLTGRPLPIQWPDMARTYATLRWDNRFTAMRDRWLSLIGRGNAAPQNTKDVLQVQVFMETPGPMTAEAKEESKKFFVQAAELLRAKCAATAK